MLPKTLAIIDDDVEYAEFLAQHLRERGVAVDVYDDSNRLLAAANPYAYEFYIVDLMLPGIDGADLVRIIRLRSQAGLIVVSGRLGPEVFEQVVDAGADMYLAKPVRFAQLEVAIKAVNRRIVGATVASGQWRLDRAAGRLIAPDGAQVELSDVDRAVMDCFLEADGADVTREMLCQRLGRKLEGEEGDDGLNAAIYRLRRRIERATPLMAPLQSRSRVGYVFKAPLQGL